MTRTARMDGERDHADVDHFGTRRFDEAAAATFELLECLSLGILLIRRDGTIAFSNHRAQELMETSELRLSTIVGNVATDETRRLMTPYGRVILASTHRFEHSHDQDLIAAVFMSGLNDTGDRVDPVIIQTLFDLTPAEARVALAISRGDTLAETARNLHVSKSTVRSQLKKVFEKVGVRRQAELVTRLMSIPPLAH